MSEPEMNKLCTNLEQIFLKGEVKSDVRSTVSNDVRSTVSDHTIKKIKINKFDSMSYIYQACDIIQEKDTKLYICERELKCKCKKECICDSDNYFKILKFELTEHSNNMISFRFLFENDIVMNKRKNFRLFTLHDNTQEEKPVIDIVKNTDNSRISETNIIFPCMCEAPNKIVKFPVDGNICVKYHEIYFSINHMLYV